MKARYQPVSRLAAEHPIGLLCRFLAVSRSGYYNWRDRVPSHRQQQDAQLTQELLKAFAQSRSTYGRPRLTRHLQAIASAGWDGSCDQQACVLGSGDGITPDHTEPP